jgi:hypothetical protein
VIMNRRTFQRPARAAVSAHRQALRCLC